MKKYVPFVFPLLAVIAVLFLGFRWYQAKMTQEIARSQTQTPTDVQQLTPAEVRTFTTPSKDIKMTPLEGTGEGNGVVRYEIKDGRVLMYITADLAPVAAGSHYELWVKGNGVTTWTKVGALTENKGGYMGSAAVSAETLPVDVVISQEKNDDMTMELEVVKGVVSQQ